jgi:hypothetical protein
MTPRSFSRRSKSITAALKIMVSPPVAAVE